MMRTGKIAWRHLTSSADLVTTYEAIRAGFVALALEKNRRATPTVEEARLLKAAASRVRKPAALADAPGIEAALLAAAGVSDKARRYMGKEDRARAIQGLIREFLEPAGDAFVEELVYRFLLTRGDSLGGSMRNLGGVMAQRRFTRAMIATLNLAGVPCQWLDSRSGAWMPVPSEDAGLEERASGLAWTSEVGERTMVYNRMLPLVGKNVDLSLLNCAARSDVANSPSPIPALFLALGELKGGIDPAGADEHWKTARTTLSRIRTAFSGHELMPRTFFVGAAIVKGMAEEIWKQLQEGTLTNAANLTDPAQTQSICDWLAGL